MMGAPSHAKRHKRVKDATGGARERAFVWAGWVCYRVCLDAGPRGMYSRYRDRSAGPVVVWN